MVDIWWLSCFADCTLAREEKGALLDCAELASTRLAVPRHPWVRSPPPHRQRTALLVALECGEIQAAHQLIKRNSALECRLQEVPSEGMEDSADVASSRPASAC